MVSVKDNSKLRDVTLTVLSYALIILFFVGGFVWIVSLDRRAAEESRRIESSPAYQACMEEKSKKPEGGAEGVYYSWRCTDEGELVNETTTYEEYRSGQEAEAGDYCDVNRCR